MSEPAVHRHSGHRAAAVDEGRDQTRTVGAGPFDPSPGIRAPRSRPYARHASPRAWHARVDQVGFASPPSRLTSDRSSCR